MSGVSNFDHHLMNTDTRPVLEDSKRARLTVCEFALSHNWTIGELVDVLSALGLRR